MEVSRGARRSGTVDLDSRPILVFWEATRACSLACRHCRAEAIPEPPPGELTHEEAVRFVRSLEEFGRPAPILVVTGGDAMMRPDLMSIVETAAASRVPVALAPSVTPLLTDERLLELRRRGVKVVSVSLDGASARTHDGLRQVEGHFEQTLDALRRLRALGFVVQVNTVVSAESVEELPAVAAIVRDAGAAIWEVFFLVHVGRGTGVADLSAEENEDVCAFLWDASRHGFVVRTVEAPFFRRIAARRDAGAAVATGPLYRRLSDASARLLGPPTEPSKAHTKGTRDGRGIVFVSSTGAVYPAGFLPLELGNVRRQSLVALYRDHPLLRDIRAARFTGKCGRCEYATVCGGSRARAYAVSGDPLASDPACAYEPHPTPGVVLSA